MKKYRQYLKTNAIFHTFTEKEWEEFESHHFIK